MSTSTSKSILKGEVESSRKQGLESDEDGDEDEEVPPHQLRGGLYSFTQTKHSVCMNKLNPNHMCFIYLFFNAQFLEFNYCTACSLPLVEAYRHDRSALVRLASNATALEKLSGVDQLAAGIESMGMGVVDEDHDDDDW